MMKKKAPAAPGRALTLAEEMKPLLMVMRGINIMPLNFTADGGVTFRWGSAVMLLSVVEWAVSFVNIVNETIVRIHIFVESLSYFSENVFNTFFFLLLNHHYLTPGLHWPAAPLFAKYLNDWAQYQARFQVVTGRPLRLGVRPLATHKAIACVAVPCVLAVFLGRGMATSNWHNIIVGLQAACFHASVPAFWDVLGTAAVNSANQLRDCFKEEITASGGAPAAARVREYRELWLQFRALAERAPTAWGACTLHYLLCCISAVLINGFGVLAAVTNKGQPKVFLTVAMFLMMVDSLWHTAVVCAAGQHMGSAVDSGARDVLLNMRTSTPPTADKATTASALMLQREVFSFLNVMREPVVISLYGYIALEVTLIVTIVETLATYLCVLLQFTINFQSPDVPPPTPV